jgi:predicted carbohydrate-binding protein with CBM5 and CBM33 domain
MPASTRAAMAALAVLLMASVALHGVNAHGWLASPRARNFGDNQGNGLGASAPNNPRCNMAYQNCPGNPGEVAPDERGEL